MTEKNNSGIAGFLLRSLADPILMYVTVVVTSIMYHYRAELAFVYGLLTYVIGWFVFRVFDFINKHNLIGSAVYIIMLIAVLRISDSLIETGYRHYPITFALWFLTPQDSLLYSKHYTMAIFALFLFFMLSVIYYFTRVRYRIFMNFLIFIIPFAIYGKEYEEMPIGFIIALAVGYVLIMALYRQLSDTEKSVVIDKGDAWKSAAVFTVLFALISALIPKPTIEADRTALEQLINADALTDRLVAMLNVFRDTSDGEQFRSQANTSVLYYAKSEMPLQLKTSTFTYYNYYTDSWDICDLDSEYYKHTERPMNLLSNGLVTEAIWTAAKYDSEFAAQFGLEELAGMELDLPQIRKVSLISTYQSGNTAPVPQGARVLTDTNYDNTIGLTHSGVVYAHKSEFPVNATFTFEYEPGAFFSSNVNKHAAELISRVDNYEEMLGESNDVLFSLYEAKTTDIPDKQLLQYSRAMKQNADDYDYYRMGLLEYGDDQQIYDLAQEITAGLDSDFDKAVALEWYFINNDYVYDQTYRKEKGDNAVDFLFKTKKGVCYEYATSMTLLARAAGIPARYCEGFNMQDLDPQGDGYTYLVRGSDAHGFPELYIKGYGWLDFEPTMSDDPVTATGRNAGDMLKKYGLIILALSVIALVIILLSSAIAHCFFLIINGRRAPNDAVKGIMRRICRIYRIPQSSTAHQAEETVRSFSGADIGAAADLFDRSQYGKETLTPVDKALATEQYKSAYKALRAAKKAARGSKKQKTSVTQ